VDSGSQGHRGKDLSAVCQSGKGVGERHLAECRVVRSQDLCERAGLEHIAPHDLRRYAESEIMPNRDSKPPANPRESYRSSIVRPGPCGIIRCASKDMHEAQHSPSIVQHPFLFFGQLPRRPHAVGAPRRVLESITNFTARYAWANLIEASSVFRFSAGARLCRITPPRNSAGCCHSAGIRHDPGFGIMQSIFRLAARLQKWPWPARNRRNRAGDLKMLCIMPHAA
jgi:hypothetical protein